MEDLKTTEHFLQQISLINKKYDEIAKITGEGFNIFSIMKMESDEVRLHSRFIGELLNPFGKHNQGALFLKLFVEHVVNKLELEIYIDEELEKATIIIEENIGLISDDYEKGGRIDLVIKPNGEKKVIVIENKIYAIDQHKQLVRYKQEYPKSILLYLTLNGKQPDETSIKNDENNLLKKDHDFYCISYEEQILIWLKECIKYSYEKPLLRETISQYINLIKHLTHQTMNEDMNKELLSNISKNPEYIESAEIIYKSWLNVRFKIIENLKIHIIKISNTLGLNLEFDETNGLGSKYSGFWFFKSNWKYCIYFYFDSDFEDLFIGIDTRKNGDGYDTDLKVTIQQKLTGLNIGKELKYDNWIWCTRFGQWDDTAWKDVDSLIPVSIKENVEKILKKLEGVDLCL